MCLKTYIVQYTHSNGNGWAIINCSSPSFIENILKKQSKMLNVQVVSYSELRYFGEEMGLVYEGCITTIGQSPYDIAVANGFRGSVTEWLQSLVGPEGSKGDKGDKGDTGEKGDKGDQGIGIPTGGATGQLLAKKTNTDYDTEWQDPYDDTQVRTLIQQTADNFANYYTKSETYSQSQVDQLLRTQREGQYVPVNALPTASAETMFKIYLVPSSDPQTSNIKDEYITIDNGSEATTRYTWEKIGSTDVDLSGYSTTEEMNAAIDAALQGKQDTLVSGTNIKTINNQSILGSGNITIQGGGSSVQSDWNQTDTEADDYIKNKPTIPTVPTNVSAFTNDAGYVTKTVNDLVNYYLKSDVYTKAEVANLIAAIQQFHYEIYASISVVTSPAGNVLYLIGPTGTGSDKYEEYVYDATKQEPWVKIGDTSIDLSDYYTKGQTDSAITSALNTALANYTTTAALTPLLAGKQDVINDLATIRSGASAGATAYQKPAGGIPKTDLAQGVQDSLDLADTALQEDTLYEDANGHDCVEIGGMKWATKNIGANAVTDAGLYFQWGDTQGYTAEQVGVDKDFTWDDYKWTNDGGTTMTKYNATDGKTILDLEDDAARANWGGSWRMPTTEEMQAFGAAVNAVWTDDYQGSGVAGLVCTDKTDNTKVVFFPAAGHCVNGIVNYVGSFGEYWGSSLVTDSVQDVYYLYFYNGYMDWWSDIIRCCGCAVRPILDTTQLKKDLDKKQNTLVSGTNIKTINNESILGSGNINIDISGKEDVTTIVAPVNATDATLPITSLACEIGKYYRIDVAVETLAITLPAMTDLTTVRTVVIYLTTGNAPAITISSSDSKDVYYQDGFAIESGKTYEVNCLWNGIAWVVASVEIIVPVEEEGGE